MPLQSYEVVERIKLVWCFADSRMPSVCFGAITRRFGEIQKNGNKEEKERTPDMRNESAARLKAERNLDASHPSVVVLVANVIFLIVRCIASYPTKTLQLNGRAASQR